MTDDYNTTQSPCPGECISNDPVAAGEAEYKPWSGPFGSARPIRGLQYRFQYPSEIYLSILYRVYQAYHHGDLMLLGCRTLICRVEPEWDRAVCRLERELVETVRTIDK